MKVTDKSFGGGNQFSNNLYAYLNKNGHEMIDHLNDDDIDVIILTDPRAFIKSSAYTLNDVSNYLRSRENPPYVFHRINECDERKGTRFMNSQLELANRLADHTIYIASWLIDLFKKQNLKFTDTYSTILNGADASSFVKKKKELKEGQKIRFVTHHWSANLMKGWDVYMAIEERLKSDPEFDKKFEFWYIGNAPADLKIEKIKLLPPCTGKELGEKLGECDFYLTASICEPGGMHHVEGGMSGLPIVYRDSGALPEYCHEYGVEFKDKDDVFDAIEELVNNFDKYSEKMVTYDRSAEKMCSLYMKTFEDCLELQKKKTKKPNLIEKFYILFMSHSFRVLAKLGFH